MHQYLDFSQPPFLDSAEARSAVAQQQQPQQSQQLFAQPSGTSVLDPAHNAFYPPTLPSQIPCEIKPRLTKEQHDILEGHYQQQHKPPTNTKRHFAETLNVSLEKVNNWFQNRRAKAKQDAKKQADTFSSINDPSQIPATQSGFSSDSDASPLIVSPEYYAAMEQWAGDESQRGDIGILQHQLSQEHLQPPTFIAQQDVPAEYTQNPSLGQTVPHENSFEDMLEYNRRTLTQETFNALARNGGMVNGAGTFEDLETGFSGDHDILKAVFPEYVDHNSKLQDGQVVFPYQNAVSLSSYDSTVPSVASEYSINNFPSSAQMQENATFSASSSDYSDSRASSLSLQKENSFVPTGIAMQPPSQPQQTTAQWQPGQSVPVDINALSEHFRQVAQQKRQSPPQPQSQTFDQPVGWPSEAAFARRGSQTSMLAQSLSNVGINTPQPPQSATFKSPAPPSNIAARRQRPRPAALGLAALRSQSYSDGLGPASAGVLQQQPNSAGVPNLRRIRSSNVISGVAQGRVQKSISGSAQRSPINWTFADSLHSPSIARHMSQSQENLTPPTPRTPGESAFAEQLATLPLWQSSSGHVNPQPGITEADGEAELTQPAFVLPSNAVAGSPPHTPFNLEQQFFAPPNGHRAVLENTPPQSAPASQQSFPSHSFAPLVSQPLQTATTQAQLPQHINKAAIPPQQQYMGVIVPEPQLPMANVVFAPQQQLTANISGPAPRVPIQFANGKPFVNADGNIEMAFPQARMHFVPQRRFSQSAQMEAPPNNITPPQTTYQFVTSSGNSLQPSTALQFSKPTFQTTPELLVHEYAPPEDLKRSATPRKGPEVAPKSYTFTNQTPEHFENQKSKKGDAKASSVSSASPASSSNDSAVATSVTA